MSLPVGFGLAVGSERGSVGRSRQSGADFQVCCIAGFHTCDSFNYPGSPILPRSADLEIGDTAGLETCGTNQAGSGAYGLKKAFTLIELLVVIGIISILAALLLPTLARSKATARAAACMSNLHQVGIALQMYLQENNNRLPAMRDQSASPSTNTVPLPPPNVVLGPQLGNTNVLRCPADNQGIFEQTGCSYSWNSLLNGQEAGHLKIFGMVFNPTQIPLMFDKAAFHIERGPNKGVNYLYGDTHIQNLLVVEGSTP